MSKLISFKTIKGSDDFKDAKKYFTKVLNVVTGTGAIYTGLVTNSFLRSSALENYCQAGVDALSSMTPLDSGKTASSWYYKIERSPNKIVIGFYNSNVNKGVPIAVILQYGHGTGTGGWVEGRDYINPAIQPVFDNIAEAAWKEVTKL